MCQTALATSLLCVRVCVLSAKLLAACGLPWSRPGAGPGDGEEEHDANWCQNCQAALNGLSEAFNHSMQAYTQGEHEQYRERELPPHAHAHNGHHMPQRSLPVTAGSSARGLTTNLIKSKGMSKVSMRACVCVCIVHCVLCIRTYIHVCCLLRMCCVLFVCVYVCLLCQCVIHMCTDWHMCMCTVL